MKKQGVLNASVCRVIAQMGHTDKMIICDAGLPIPRSIETIDLAVTANIPRFLDVLRVVLEEGCFEAAVVAAEMEKYNPTVYGETVKVLEGIPMSKVPHEEFKRMGSNGSTSVYIRTGEVSPFSNVILISGVTF
jgi:D-ribose pyranase